jgi:hypothetical protein
MASQFRSWKIFRAREMLTEELCEYWKCAEFLKNLYLTRNNTSCPRTARLVRVLRSSITAIEDNNDPCVCL